MHTITIRSLEQIDEAAIKFLEITKGHNIFAFYGEMGIGKTTFIKAICDKLDVTDVVNSPSFAIINEYRTKAGKTIYHFDFYRINKVEEAFDFGYEDYFYSNNICFMEWPEKVESLLPGNTVTVNITQNSKEERILKILKR